MATQGALVLGIVLVVLLLILVARARASGAPDRQDARDLLRETIDAHIEALAQRYLEARSDGRIDRPGVDRFGQEIELFIGGVLRRAESAEPYLRDALREIVVLERDAVYGEVRERVAAYLGRPPAAK